MGRKRKNKAAPTGSRLESDIKTTLRDGHWRESAWFLESGQGLSSSRQGRHTHSELVRSADSLAELYTPEACRQIFANPGRGPNITVLFMLVDREWTFPFIRLGLDLADIGAKSSVLYGRLRDGGEFQGARLEAELWAALVRGGAEVDFDPKLPGNRGDKSPDFRVIWDYREYFVETKGVCRAEANNVADEVIRAFFDAVVPSLRNARGVEVRFSDEFASLPLSQGGVTKLRNEQKQIVERLIELASGLAEGSISAGEHDVIGLGSVAIRRTEESYSTSIGDFRTCPPEKEAERILRMVREAAQQIPSRGKGFVFVDGSKRADLADVEALIKARPSPRFSNVEHIVVRTHTFPTAARLVSLPGVETSPGDQEFARLLMSGRG